MKNKFSFLFLAISAFSLFGCGNEPTSSEILVEHDISIIPADHVLISVNKNKAFKGDEIQISVSHIDEGYEIESIKANGHVVDNFRFIMPDENVAISSVVKEAAPGSEYHAITIINDDMGYVEADKSFAKRGETVHLAWTGMDRFVFDYYELNGICLKEQEFVMPDEDVTIELFMKDSIVCEDNFLLCYAAGLMGRSFWRFEYGLEGMEVNVQVMDRYVSGSQYQPDIGYRDNIEFILSVNNDCEGLLPFYTKKFLISCDNAVYIQSVDYDGDFGQMFAPSSDFFFSEVTQKSKQNGDGYDGYDVYSFVSYQMLGLTRSEAIGNLSVCMAMRNTMFLWNTNWVCDNNNGCSWLSGKTHPRVSESGELIYKTKKEETA